MTTIKKKLSSKLYGRLGLAILLLCACAEVKNHCGDFISVAAGTPCPGGTTTYTITYNTNGGSGTTPYAETVNAGYSVYLASGSGLTRSGYTFGGWNTSSYGTGTNYSAGALFTPTGNITLYARWNTVTTNTYTLTVNAGTGGTVNPTSQSDITAGTPVSITATPSGNYAFSNWTVTSGTATFANANSANTTVTLSSNATIRANFQQVTTPPSGGTFTDTRDGKTYKYVKIGNQTWMAENLNYNVSGSVCYGNEDGNCTKYGRLYDWATVMGLPASCNSSSCASQVQSKHRGICPAGWHVPSDAEWTALTEAVGGAAGTKLKSKTGWYSGDSYYKAGTDEYGFSALPGGYDYGGDFSIAGNHGYWWSATEYDAGLAWDGYMGYNYEGVGRHNNGKAVRFSLRCSQD